MFVPLADPAVAGAGNRSMEEKRALYAAAAKKVRGFICVASASPMKEEDDALAPAYYHELAEFYVEAARRLPIADIPYLANCISIGGLAVGLADPVTNIILTTINAFAANWPPSRHRPCVPPLKPHAALEKTRKKTTFAVGAHNSRDGLIAFLTCYFRNLTEDQAKKLLDMAGHHLPLAVHLVEVGLWGLGSPLHPDGARTKTALQMAAKSVRCSMTGDLVRLMTWRYPPHLLHPVLDDLRAGKRLTPQCISKLCDLLRSSWLPQPTPAPTPGITRDTTGNVTTIIKVRKDLFATTTISKDLVTTTTITSTCPSNDDHFTDDCVHLSTELAATDDVSSSTSVNSRVCSWRENPDFFPLLKMSVLDTMHGFYIVALGMLPSHALRDHHLVRSILTAGHCFGPLDPVSNIIVNSIWYHAAFPLSEDVSNQIGAADILDARSLSRVESRSLDGWVALLGYTCSISEQQAVAQLREQRYDRYDLSYIFRGGPEKTLPDLAAAALVAKHPQPAAFGDFLTSLFPAKRDRLCSLIRGKGLGFVLSGDTLEQLKNLVANETTGVVAAAAQSRAPHLGQSALETLSIRRETFKSQQDYVRTKLENLLLDYSRDKGSFYKLGTVCGVTTERYGFYSTCYHINFLAIRDDPNDDSTRSWELFFAEFWSIVDSQVEHSTNVPFCCPVIDSSDRGHSSFSVRCGVCDQASCNIAHPCCDEYVYFTGNTEYDFPVHHEWGSDLGGMLESDFIYFDSKSDDEFAKILSEESSSSPKKPRVREEYTSSQRNTRAREESTSSQRNTRARTGDDIGALAPFRKV